MSEQYFKYGIFALWWSFEVNDLFYFQKSNLPMHIVLKSQISITWVMFNEPYYVPGTPAGTWVVLVNEEDKDPCPVLLTFYQEKKNH